MSVFPAGAYRPHYPKTLKFYQILSHLGLVEERSHSPPQAPTVKELTYEPCYDDLLYEESICAR